MKNKGLVAITIYLIMMFVAGFGFGCTVYTDKYEELKGINNNLYYVIEELENNYDELEQKMIEYRWLYEDCQTTFGDYQDRVEAGCFVNGGWNCE